MKITPGQIRAARRLAGVSQADLVKATGLSPATIKRAESERVVSISGAAVQTIRGALEAEGVIFLPPGEGGGAGVKIGLRQGRLKP